jgi:hypothetical protein
MEGVAHTVEVTAATLYEAVALGLKQIRGNDWVEGIAGALNPVTVCVKNVQVEHTILIGEFPSSPWWNHDSLSDEICIGDSGDFDDG